MRSTSTSTLPPLALTPYSRAWSTRVSFITRRSSGASNWGWTSADLKKAYTQNKADWQKAYGAGEPPMDMLLASGSGLDPHVSPQAAELQVPRVAAARHLPSDAETRLLALVKRSEEAPQLGFLGEPRVNVLDLNLALDAAFPKAGP